MPASAPAAGCSTPRSSTTSPAILHHIARAPAVDVRWDSAAILIATGVLTAAIGAIAFAHRDLESA